MNRVHGLLAVLLPALFAPAAPGQPPGLRPRLICYEIDEPPPVRSAPPLPYHMPRADCGHSRAAPALDPAALAELLAPPRAVPSAYGARSGLRAAPRATVDYDELLDLLDELLASRQRSYAYRESYVPHLPYAFSLPRLRYDSFALADHLALSDLFGARFALGSPFAFRSAFDFRASSLFSSRLSSRVILRQRFAAPSVRLSFRARFIGH